MNEDNVKIYVIRKIIESGVFKRMWYRRISYVEKKYEINKYNSSIVGEKPEINKEWKKVIDNYLLKRKLRVKLPEKGIIEKRKKI